MSSTAIPYSERLEGVAQLVKRDADEEEQGRDHAEERALQPGTRLDAPVVDRPDEDEDEGDVDLDRDASHAQQRNRPAHQGLLSCRIRGVDDSFGRGA